MPAQVTAAQRELAEQAVERLGIPRQVDARTALVEVIWEAAGNVAFLRQQSAELGADLSLLSSSRSDGEYGTIVIRDDVKAVVKLYGEWVDRLATYASTAVKIGLGDQLVQIAQREADVIVRAVTAALDAAGITGEARIVGQQAAVTVLREHQAVLTAGERN